MLFHIMQGILTQYTAFSIFVQGMLAQNTTFSVFVQGTLAQNDVFQFDITFLIQKPAGKPAGQTFFILL